MNYEADQLRKELRELQAEVERLRDQVTEIPTLMRRAAERERELEKELEDTRAEAHRMLVMLKKRERELVGGLHQISLCSQNSMSSKEECGRIARRLAAREAGDE